MPFSANYNPFSQSRIVIPSDKKNFIKELVEADEENPDIKAPFNRMVDVWYFAFCLGVKNDESIFLKDDLLVGMVDGNVLQGDLSKILFLMTHAISYKKDPYIIEKPNEVLQIASAFATGGLPYLEDMVSGAEGKLNNISINLLKEIT